MVGQWSGRSWLQYPRQQGRDLAVSAVSAVEEEARAVLPAVAWLMRQIPLRKARGDWRRGVKQLAGPLGPTLGPTLGILMQASAFSLEKYHCPVLYTVFTNNTHIVAIRTTGNVYAYEVGSRELCRLLAL